MKSKLIYMYMEFWGSNVSKIMKVKHANFTSLGTSAVRVSDREDIVKIYIYIYMVSGIFGGQTYQR